MDELTPNDIRRNQSRPFLERLAHYFTETSVPLDAEYSHSKGAVPLAASVSLRRTTIKKGEAWGKRITLNEPERFS